MKELLDALVPPRCAGCGQPGAWLCQHCRAELDPVSVRGRLTLRGAGAYEGPLRRAVHRLKYGGERGLAAELGDLVARLVCADQAGGAVLDALVAVPLHPRRARSRGYDQSLLLAERTAALSGLPLLPALHRIRHVRPQVELGREERSRNVAGAFVCVAGALRGLRVALVDDVATTGATLAAAASAARAGGAARVSAYVVAVDL